MSDLGVLLVYLWNQPNKQIQHGTKQGYLGHQLKKYIQYGTVRHQGNCTKGTSKTILTIPHSTAPEWVYPGSQFKGSYSTVQIQGGIIQDNN